MAGSGMTEAPPGLVRAVGRWGMVGLMVNSIIGAGIFGLPSTIHSLTGPYGLLAFAACAVVVACIALCFAEVGSRFTQTGGPYLYTRTAFGPQVGFLVGWLMWITRVTALAAISNVMASYLAFFWAPAGAGSGRAAAIAAVLVSLTAINLAGVRQAAGVSGLLAVGKLVPLVLFVGVGAFFLDPGPFAGSPLPGATAFTQAIFQLIFAFGGFEAMVIAAGESKDPRRDVPFALLVAIAGATLLYVSIQAVCIGTLPTLESSTRPLADASVRFAGAVGGTVIGLGALISTTGTLCASVLVGPRLLYAMAEQDQLPGAFGLTHPRFRTPYAAILSTAGLGLALAVSGTFVYLLGLNVISRLATYLGTAGALLVLRRHQGERPALFTVPAGGIVATLAMVACLWLLARSGLRELRDVGIALGAGLCIHAAHRGWGRRGETGHERGAS
jgi:amino acid transporter